jgi:hypothetical protein
MPIVIEELDAQVIPETRRSEGREDAPRERRSPNSLADQLRAALAREQRRSERLSDR